MRANSVLIPGSYDDVFVYRDWVLGLTAEKTLRIYSMRNIVEFINGASPNTAITNEFLFRHSDWQSTQPIFSLFLNDPVISRRTLRLMDQFPYPYLVIDESRVDSIEIDPGLNFSYFLSMYVYAWRVYLALDTGVYAWDIDWSGSRPEPIGPMVKRSDARCYCIVVRYGAAAASCGDDGLLMSIEEFGPFNSQRAREMQPKATRSVRSQWLSTNLVNYSAQNRPALIVNQATKGALLGVREKEQLRITEMARQENDLTYLLRSNTSALGANGNEVIFATNGRSTFLAQDSLLNLYLIGMGQSDSTHPEQRYVTKYERVRTRVIDASISQFGTVIETDFSLLLFRKGKLYELVKAEIAAYRTFGAAKRFRNIIALVQDEGIRLVGLVDDSTFAVRASHGRAVLRELDTRRSK
jgi:hypothetical protein